MPNLVKAVLVLAVGAFISVAAPASPNLGWKFACERQGTVSHISMPFDSFVMPQPTNGRGVLIENFAKKTKCVGQPAETMDRLPYLGAFELDYEGGSEDERIARIVADPVNPTNQVLQFWLQSPNARDGKGVAKKARIQTNFYRNQGLREIQYSVRLFLSKDFEEVRNYPEKIGWLTVSEWWNNAGWSKEEYPFRISINIVKPEKQTAAPLRFDVHAQTFDKLLNRWDNNVWFQTNKNFAIPTQKWITLDYYWREGDRSKGRFYLAATPDGEARSVIFDVHDITHHPDDPAPDGLTHFNPMKLYTSRPLVNYVKSRGRALNIYWDNFDLKFCNIDIRRSVGCFESEY